MLKKDLMAVSTAAMNIKMLGPQIRRTKAAAKEGFATAAWANYEAGK